MTLNHSGPHVMSQLPRPLWKHPKIGVFTKLFLSLSLYIYIYIHVLVGHTLRVMVEDGLLHVYHAWFCGRIGFLTLLPGSVRSLVPRHYWRWAFWAVLSKTCREPTMVKKGQIMSLNVERSWNQINSEYGKQDPNYLTVHTLLYTIVIYYILYIGYIHVNYLLTDLSGSLVCVCVCSVCVCVCVFVCVFVCV